MQWDYTPFSNSLHLLLSLVGMKASQVTLQHWQDVVRMENQPISKYELLSGKQSDWMEVPKPLTLHA